MKRTSRCSATVDLSAVRHNFKTVKALLPSGCKVLSVVKADGYGHGAIEIAKTLKDSDYFGVACLDEAVQLRQQGIKTPILILGYTSVEDASALLEFHLTQCVFNEEYLLALHEAIPEGQRLKIHVKIDTGMNRLGFSAGDETSTKETARRLEEIMEKTPRMEYEGIFTHFASSENSDESYTKKQFTCFLQVTEALKRRGITFPLRHCANSGAVLLHPEMHLDMVRPGIILYGYPPSPSLTGFDLRPALEWNTLISQVHTLSKGDTVSYNQTFRAEGPMVVATICVGYADGLNRTLSNQGTVLVNGHKAKILGNICMDQCVIDVTGIPVKTGDSVTLIGANGDLRLTAEDMARDCRTISYEVLCNIGKRVPRIYQDNKTIG